ncbi:MAG TPA: 30S ribosomal protein S5 [Firmicutes bacterium]|nr:30S ribosomal protein S5 [Bacillota bacterium]
MTDFDRKPSDIIPQNETDVIEVIEEEIIEEITEPLAYQDRVIHINRVAKVVKGGRRFTFTALVAMGDGQGKVGLGYGKAGDVLTAIKKGQEKAKKAMIEIPIVKGSIPHSVKQKYSAAVVFLKPASEGTGVIAGGPVRSLLEMAGVHNVLAKSIGRTNNRINVAKATFEALKSLKSPEEIRARRGVGSES